MKFRLLIDPYEQDFDSVFQCYEYQKYKRPSISKIDRTDQWFRYLKDDLHSWFKEHKIEYSLQFDSSSEMGRFRWLINIPNIEHAILYKLTWL
jgi:hypothetical protein